MTCLLSAVYQLKQYQTIQDLALLRIITVGMTSVLLQEQ